MNEGFSPKIRKISLDGCPCIGKGGCGVCYRLDEETIVKLYYDFVTDEEIEKRKKICKGGICCGDSYGNLL